MYVFLSFGINFNSEFNASVPSQSRKRNQAAVHTANLMNDDGDVVVVGVVVDIQFKINV